MFFFFSVSIFMCFFTINFYVFDSQYIYKDEDIYIYFGGGGDSSVVRAPDS